MSDVVEFTRRFTGRVTGLFSGRKHSARVKTKFSAHMLEVEDLNFHHDSAVLMPDYGDDAPKEGSEKQNRITGLAVLQACYAHAKAHPEQTALVVGHTDRSGSTQYNQSLSELRAANVLHALRGERDAWAKIAHEKHKVEDYQQILAWVNRRFGWGCDPGAIDNQPGPKTEGAVRTFQERYNQEHSGTLAPTGSVGLATWGAFFDMYVADLRRLMNVDTAGLAEARNALHFLSCCAIGCGEGFPITSNRKEHYQSPVDRRVEILFFDSGEEPLLDCAKPHGACSELYEKKMYAFTPIKAVKAVPTSYKAKLVFLGPAHVPHDTKYRCTFALKEDGGAEIAAGAELTAAAYRIFANDDHALRDADGDMLGGDGDKTSRPDNYSSNNWVRNVRPAVAFRVEVEQYRDGNLVPVAPDRIFVKWELEDGEEEYARWDESMNPVQPKKWMKDFIDLFKRDKGNAGSKEDDNCSKDFGGVREAGVKVKPASVLFKTPFATASPRPLDSTAPESARAAVAAATNAAGSPVGHSDVIFFPPPVGGDNYKFKLTLTDEGGQPLPLNGGAQGDPVVLNTGTFTFWRRTVIDLLVTFDNVDTNYIKWDQVKAAYRAGFVEVEGPKEIKKYDEATWKKVVRSYFINTVGLRRATVNDDARYTYGSFFLPNLPDATADDAGREWCWTHGEALSKVFLKRAYKDTGRKSPRSDTNQEKRPGLFVFLCKDLHTVSTALGMYLGEREFFMVTVSDGTVTFVHEMGHALYLRHSLISFDRANSVTHDILNENWLDHDQKDALTCAMAYQNDYYGPDGATVRASNPVSWHFCSVCALTLRHYDRVEMSRNADYRKLIYQEFNPIRLTNSSYAAFPGGKTTIKKNARLVVKAIGAAEGVVNNHGVAYRKDLTSISKGKWVSSDPALAQFESFVAKIDGDDHTLKGRLRGKNAGAGKITVHFEIDGIKSDTLEVELVD